MKSIEQIKEDEHRLAEINANPDKTYIEITVGEYKKLKAIKEAAIQTIEIHDMNAQQFGIKRCGCLTCNAARKLK